MKNIPKIIEEFKQSLEIVDPTKPISVGQVIDLCSLFLNAYEEEQQFQKALEESKRKYRKKMGLGR